MIRAVFFIMGSFLLIVAPLLANQRADAATDSPSILAAIQDAQGGTYFTEVTFAGEEQRILKVPEYVLWYDWSPDGVWLMLKGQDFSTNKERIYLYHRASHMLKLLRDHVDLIDQPRWSPDGKAIAYIEVRANGEVSIQHVSLQHETLGAYHIAGEGRADWTFLWRDNHTIEVLPLFPEPGYVIDLENGLVAEREYSGYGAVVDHPNVSPNKQFRIDNQRTLINLLDLPKINKIIWQIEDGSIQWQGWAGWSDDSQLFSVIGQDLENSTLDSYINNIFIFDVASETYQQLTDDARIKYLSTNKPFSHQNAWLLFETDNGPSTSRTLHAIRTDGSGEEISGWFHAPTFWLDIGWTPPIPTLPYHMTLYLLGGFGLILSSLALSLRRVMA